MATRTITVHDRCTTPDCKRALHSIGEGERGLCSTCWIKQWSPEKKASMAMVIKAAFDPNMTAEQKDAALDEAIKFHGKG